MKNEFTKSGFIKNSAKIFYGEFIKVRTIKVIMIFAFTFFAYELFAQPVITSFSPHSGPVNTTVTITGSGFSNVPSLNVVFFGAYKVFVSASTNTSLTVNAPTGSNYQYISVTNVETNLTGYSTIPFNVTFPGGCKPDFASKVDFTSGTNPYSVSFCDMDKNGKPDLAVTNFGSNTVSVYYNISVPGTINAGSFAAKIDYVTGASPKSVTFGDIDGDGSPDMIVTNSGDTSVSVFRNTSTFGNVSFAARVNFPSGGSPWSVSVGDLNGDGKPELAVVNRVSWTVSVLRNNSTSGVISFLPKVDFATGSSPYSVSIGDLDGDSKPDMAVANSGINTASVYKNTSSSGSISFAAKVDFSAGGGPFSISIGDIDGDGKPDLAVANNSSNNASVFRNTTTPGIINAGSFAAKVDFPAGGAPQIISIGDIDGDGKPDLAVANFTGNSVSVLRNASVSGTVSFSAKVDLTTAGQASYVNICDIDGDGKPDVAATNYNNNTLSVFRNISTPAVLQTSASGNGNPITNGSVTPNITNHTDFGNIHVNANLIRTYTFLNTSTDSLSIDSIKITGTDQALFTPGSITPAGKIAPGVSKTFTVTFVPTSSGLKTAAVNIYSNINSGTICVLQQTYTFAVQGTGFCPALTSSASGNGNPITNGSVTPSLTNFTDFGNLNSIENLIRTYSFQNTSTDSLSVDSIKMSGADPSSFIPGSLTPTGKIAPGASKTFTVTYVMSSLGIKNATVNIYSNIDSGSVCLIQQTYTFAVKANQISLAPVITTFSPQSGPAGTTVTITGSGFNTTPSNNIVFFGAALATVSASTETSLTVSAPAGANFKYISVTNLASNLTGYSSMPFLETFPGGCKTEFAARVNFSTGGTPYSVSIGDLDGDGKSDLAVANYTSNTVSVFRNISTTGGVSFAARVDFGTGSSPKSVCIGEIDGDGKPDLVVTNSGVSNSVSVFRNTSTTGGVSFAAKVDFATGSSPWSVSMGDLNGDGKTDLAVANRTGFSVSVLRNTSTSGGVSFAAKVDFSAGSSPYSVSIGDLDGDGKPDLAVASNGDNTASVYQNTSTSGGVSFAAKVDFSAGSGPVSISIGDIDGDGKPDLAVANNSGNNASVFRNTSTPGIINTGSFAARVDFAAGGAPQIISIGDIDGNGKPDLAVANFTSSSVSVLRNISVTGTVSFAAKVDLGSAGQASSVSIGDIDGDGKPEITATNYNVNSVSVFRNIALPASLQTAASGNGNPITNGSVTTSLTNFTDFGNVSTGGNLNRTYTFQNTSTDSLSVDSIKITGTDSVLFTAGSLTPPGKIASGGSKTFNVTLSPNSSGLKNATVRVYSNINSGTSCLLQQTYTFAISGTGFASVQTNALNFDGTNDNVAMPNTLTQNLTAPSVSGITIEYWFKGSNIQSAVRFQTVAGYIVAGWGTPGNQKHIISTEGGTTGINVGSGATDGSWHHVAMTWKKNTVNGFKSFLDGALVDQRNSSNTNLPVMNAAGYLGSYNGASEFMNGTLDEVRIWNRELSQTEISTNRFLQINNGTGLLASYHFNQGIAGGNNTGITTLTDATTNNYTGTLNNFTLNGPASNFVGTGPGLIPPPSMINITLIPEGMYDAGTDRLRLRDTVRAYLHSNISPFSVVDSAVAIIDSVTFNGSFIFANASNGTYYIRVNHRNSIETWSKTGGEPFVQGTTMSYDFTSAAAKAYGNNMINVDASPVRYAVYGGDIDQDGYIDLNDISLVFNAASIFLSGYVVTDVTGDNIVDLSDVTLTFNNSARFVIVLRP